MRTYLDHNATSPMSGRVRRALASAFDRLPGNASSPHQEGQAARLALERARETVARFLLVQARQVFFTSGGTEGNNAVLRGVAAAEREEGHLPGIIVSAVEHPSVGGTCLALAGEGVDQRVLRVDGQGVVDPEDLLLLLADRPASLVSVMHANNETGVLQPVRQLAEAAHAAGALFHTDAVQSAGKVSMGDAVAVSDFATLASHKVGGPAGIGAVFVRNPARIRPIVTGGAQEDRKRAGTEAVPLALGFAEALIDAGDRAENGHDGSLRDFVEEAISALEPRARIHGGGAARLPNTTNVFIPGAAGRNLVMQLDLMGYAISTGSACSTGSSRPSHVLTAMGCGAAEALDSIRISLGPATTREEIAGFLSALSEALGRSAPAFAAMAGEGAAR